MSQKLSNDSNCKMWNGFRSAQEISCSAVQHTTPHQKAPGSITKLWLSTLNTIAQWWWWACSTAWANPPISTQWRRSLGKLSFCWSRGFGIRHYFTSHVNHRLPLARRWLTIKPNICPLETTSIWSQTTSIWTLMLIFYYPSCENIKNDRRVNCPLLRA